MSLARRLMSPRTRGLGGGTVITLENAFGGMYAQLADDDTGKLVTVETAAGLPAVGHAIRVISRNIGTLPLLTYQGDGANRQRAKAAWQYSLLRRKPNPRMPAVVLWTLVGRQMAGWGEAFLGKTFTPGGRLAGLWPIRPEQIGCVRISDGEVIRDGGQAYRVEPGEKVFEITSRHGIRTYTTDEVLHIVGDSEDGVRGVSPIAQHRKALGASIALQQYGARAIRNRAIPTGILKIKGRLREGAADKRKIRAEWEALYRDASKAHRIAVLDEGAEFEPISLPLADAQFIEQTQAGVRDVARIFNLPVSKLQGSAGDSLTYKTVEGDQTIFLIDGLRPPMVFIQEALVFDEDLFPPAGSDLYCEFLVDALLAVDAMTRAKTNAIATGGAPWKRPDEVRVAENLPFDEGFKYVPTKQLDPAALKETPNAQDA